MTQRPPRVLLVTTSLAVAGAERQVVDIALGLRDRGWDVAVLSMTRPTAYTAELAAAGVALLELGLRRGRPTPVGFARYVRHVRRWRPDVVHSHMVHANLLARLARPLHPRTPVVSTVHNLIEGTRWRELAYRLTDRLASATTSISEAARDRYVRVGAAPAGRIVTVPNGIRLDRVRVPEPVREAVRTELGARTAFLWVTAGRLVPEKGHEMLVEAFAAVVARHPEARLAIAGEGPERPALERAIERRVPGGAIALLGPRDDVPALLAAADGFVLSSRWEGLPIVLLEAAAAARPIVTTDVGGCREVAPPELGAVLTEPTAPSLAAGMLGVMALSGEQRREIGERLRDHVASRYAMDRVLDRWEALYASVRAPGRAPGAR